MIRELDTTETAKWERKRQYYLVSKTMRGKFKKQQRKSSRDLPYLLKYIIVRSSVMERELQNN